MHWLLNNGLCYFLNYTRNKPGRLAGKHKPIVINNEKSNDLNRKNQAFSGATSPVFMKNKNSNYLYRKYRAFCGTISTGEAAGFFAHGPAAQKAQRMLGTNSHALPASLTPIVNMQRTWALGQIPLLLFGERACGEIVNVCL